MLLIHPTASVGSASIGDNTRIWQYVILGGNNITIGENCNICAFCFIEDGVHIGSNVTIKNGVHLWKNMFVDDNVFIGPNCTFCNDKYPISGNQDFECQSIRLEKGSSIGANSTILPGVVIGREAMIGAGSVITRNVEPNTIVYTRSEQVVTKKI